MSHPVTGVDHVFVLVEDLAASAARYARLGFTLSPRALHSAAKGSANHTIVFAEDYVELLGIVADTEDNLPRRRALARDGEGLHAVACRCADATAAEAAFARRGIRTGPPSRFERPVPLDDGTEGRAAFVTLPFDADEVPTGLLFLCQHLTPETVFRPALREHPNGARALDAVVIRSDAPRATAERFARLFGTRAGADAAVPTGSAPLLVLDGPGLAARYPGLDAAGLPPERVAGVRIRVDALDATRDVLRAGGVPFVEVPSGIAVGPAHASGAIVEFGAS